MQVSEASNVVWLAEQCHLLEKRNLDLRKELREAVEQCHRYAADADKYKSLSEELKQTVMHLNVRTSGSSKMEDKLREQVKRLKEQIKTLEEQKKEIAKDRATESRILDRVCEKHAALEESVKHEAERHAVEEGKYKSMLEDFKDLTEREASILKLDLQKKTTTIEQLQNTLRSLESELVKLRRNLMDVTEQLSDSREREQTLTLEREMLQEQLEEMNGAYRRDLSEARAQAAGTNALQARLMDTQGLLREADVELAELRRQVAETLSREGALVGRIMVARHEASEALNGRLKAEKLSQQQHIATIDLQLKLDKEMENAVARAAKEAVAVAVNELTGPNGALRSSRALKTAATKLSGTGRQSVTSSTPSGPLSRLNSKHPSSKPAVTAKILSSMAQARAKAAIDEPPMIDLGPEDDIPELADGEEDGPLAKMLHRDRSLAKQTIAQHLLQKTFDVLEKQGVRAATAGRRVATRSGNGTVGSALHGSYSNSFASTSAVPDRDGDAPVDPSGNLAQVPQQILFGRTHTATEVRISAPRAPPSPAAPPEVKCFAMTPMRTERPSSPTSKHVDLAPAPSPVRSSRRASIAVAPEEAMQRLRSLHGTPGSSVRSLESPIDIRLKTRSQQSVGRVWDVEGGAASRPMFVGSSR